MSPLDLLRDGDFRRVWLAGGLGWVMRWLELLAIGVFTFQITGSALTVALVTMARMLPMLLFSAFTGAIADRFDRRWMLLAGLAALASVSAILAALAVSGRLELWHVALGAFASGIYGTLEFPVRRTMLGEIAGPGGAGVALTLDTATNHAMRMLGPVLGGVLLETVGIQGIYLLGAVLFGLAFLLVLRTSYRSAVSAHLGPRMLERIVEGLRYLRTAPRILGTLYITLIMNFFGFPYAAMIPVIGDEVLHQNAVNTGLLLSADATGGLLGAILIANLGRPAHYARIYFLGSALFIGAVSLFSLSTWYPLSLGLLALAGFGVAGFSAMQSTIVFTSAPPEMRSRLMGVLAVCIGINPLGVLHMGLMADWLGGPMAVTVVTVEGLLAIGLASVFWPLLRR
ncbi:MAG: MFS transporter [Alphaproteobacteria bacterium]|nr:MFS transporter [Alphaproteobacteria bacterium]MDP6813738.1 MFS transporter [Alphaproteobacteria bacterium]